MKNNVKKGDIVILEDNVYLVCHVSPYACQLDDFKGKGRLVTFDFLNAQTTGFKPTGYKAIEVE